MGDIFDQISAQPQQASGDIFDQIAVQSKPAAPANGALVSAKPTGARQWLTDLESDLRYGGQQTAVGRALKSAGYQGAESLGGKEGTAGRMMVSPLTGATFAAHGIAEALSGHPLRGAGQVLSGIGEAAEIPMNFAAPETAEAATNAIPSAKYAGKLFQQVSDSAGSLPVDISGAGNSALRAQELAENGAKMPTLLNKFLKKATAPGTGEMNYDTARDFYSNAGEQSIMQRLTTSPKMQRQIAQFRGNLGDAIQATADQAGVGDQYRQALQEYSQAMQVKKLGKYALTLAAIKAGQQVLGGKVFDVIKGAATAAQQ